MNIYDQLKQLWARVTGLEKSGAAADTKIAALEAAAVRIQKDYSKTEQNTGVKWIDGKEIYFKVVTGTTDENTGNELLTNIVLENVVDLILLVDRTDGYTINYQNGLLIQKLTGNIYFSKGSAVYTTAPYVLIIYYTKPDPEPGNREPDDEPETKATKSTKKKTTNK